LLAAFGTMARRTWRAAGIATNADFAGVRSFAERGSYGALMRRYLIGARPGLLIMCHPGNPDAELGRIDTVIATRADELAYLGSDAFAADLVAAECRLARLSALAGRSTTSDSD
jgi:chitin disaccharide deacetylase